MKTRFVLPVAKMSVWQTDGGLGADAYKVHRPHPGGTVLFETEFGEVSRDCAVPSRTVSRITVAAKCNIIWDWMGDFSLFMLSPGPSLVRKVV